MFHDNEIKSTWTPELIDAVTNDNRNSKQDRDDAFVMENYGNILGRAPETTEGDGNG